MQNLFSNLLITTLASIITWAFLKFAEKVVLPWYSTLKYKGVKIDGKWITTISFKNDTKHGEVTFHETFEIKQKGNEISGTCSIKN
jgi:hypothetical protein